MKITPLALSGVFLLEREPFVDERGSFARQFCLKELAQQGLDFTICQCNLSGNTRKYTLRGLHYQKAPYPERKIVSCFSGRMLDVVVDVRPDSPTYLQHLSVELSAKNGKMLYIPPQMAHGFLTLEDDTTAYYQLSEFFHSEAYAGLRWNDPKLNIQWPTNCPIINKRDNTYELL